eukprot:6178863-Pleurochrysis_carterae.AAC.1
MSYPGYQQTSSKLKSARRAAQEEKRVVLVVEVDCRVHVLVDREVEIARVVVLPGQSRRLRSKAAKWLARETFHGVVAHAPARCGV